MMSSVGAHINLGSQIWFSRTLDTATGSYVCVTCFVLTPVCFFGRCDGQGRCYCSFGAWGHWPFGADGIVFVSWFCHRGADERRLRRVCTCFLFSCNDNLAFAKSSVSARARGVWT